MNISELVMEEEWEDLPDDPEEAFAEIIRLAQPRLRQSEASIPDAFNENDHYEMVHDLQFGFMTSLLGVAKRFKIHAFADYHVPHPQDFDRSVNRQFQADLNSFLAQATAGRALRARETTVALTDETKSKIRSYLHGLKEIIDKADMLEPRKKVLLQKLADFERELDKRRVGVIQVALVAIALAGAPGALGASADIAAKLTSNIWQEIGQAKAVEDEARVAALPSPRAAISGPEYAKRTEPKFKTSYDLNDDIPF